MLNQDYRDILSCLNEENVDYLVVGAFALAAHGYPRSTGDLDIWVLNSESNAAKLFKALAKFGAPIGDLSVQQFTSPDIVLQIGVEPCRVDILTGIDGLTYSDAIKNKVEITVEGIDLGIISKNDLLTNKLATGRDKDLGDIVWLKKNIT